MLPGDMTDKILFKNLIFILQILAFSSFICCQFDKAYASIYDPVIENVFALDQAGTFDICFKGKYATGTSGISLYFMFFSEDETIMATAKWELSVRTTYDCLEIFIPKIKKYNPKNNEEPEVLLLNIFPRLKKIIVRVDEQRVPITGIVGGRLNRGIDFSRPNVLATFELNLSKSNKTDQGKSDKKLNGYTIIFKNDSRIDIEKYIRDADKIKVPMGGYELTYPLEDIEKIIKK